MEYISRPIARYTGVIVLAIAIPVLLQLLFELGINSVIQGDGAFPWWTIQFGTVGETVLVYSTFLWVLSSIGVPVLAFYLGYRYGTRQTSPSGR